MYRSGAQVIARQLQLARHLKRSNTSRVMSTAEAASSKEVVVHENGRFVEVLLNRPSKFNALNLSMVRVLSPLYDKWTSGDSVVDCVYMHGAGGKAFCAGGDVAEIREQVLSKGSLQHDFFFEEYQLNHKIATAFERRNLVQVSVWDGVTMGGGVGLSLHGRVRIATENTLFAMPECGIGLFPDVGGTFALSRLRVSCAVGMYIALTGCRLRAKDCIFAGLATHFVKSDKLDALRSRLQQLRQAEDVEAVVSEYSAEIDEGTSDLQANLTEIEHCFSAQSFREILERLQAQNSPWADKTFKTLLSLSPKSLLVTFDAITRHAGSNVSIGDALTNEYRMSQRFMRPQPKSDFMEGIRAVLIDKDNSPVWQPATVEDIDPRDVEEFFAPLPSNHPRGELSFEMP